MGETPQNSLALRPGALLDGRYRIVRVLSAVSAYAVTYSVFDEREQELLAVKELLPRSMASRGAEGARVRPHSGADELELARAVKRFLHEAELLSDLRHGGIVRVQRTFVENGTGYVVMQHVDASPLERHARVLGGRMSVPQAVEFILPLLDALEMLHTNGLLHRDLSPATIHVDGAGHALLLSFSAHRYLPVSPDARPRARIRIRGDRAVRVEGDRPLDGRVFLRCPALLPRHRGDAPLRRGACRRPASRRA
jgi:serine/threonine protein kinase